MTRIQIRRDTSSNWSTTNPTPASGEPCFETDTSKFKIGDGTSTYNNLPYQGGSNYTLPAATTTTLGGVIPDGSTITVTEDGTISASGSAPSNMVTTDTAQTITASKTWSGTATVNMQWGTALRIYNQSGGYAHIDGGTAGNYYLRFRKAGGTVKGVLSELPFICNDISYSTASTSQMLSGSTGGGIVLGNTNNALVVQAASDISITRGSQTYTNVDSGNIGTYTGGIMLQSITQSDYDALPTKDSNTLYIING